MAREADERRHVVLLGVPAVVTPMATIAYGKGEISIRASVSAQASRQRP